MRASPISIALSLLACGMAVADASICDGRLRSVTVEGLRVPEGARCRLDGTRIEGTIEVEPGGSLEAREIAVTGDIQAEGAPWFELAGSTVEGSVRVLKGSKVIVTGTRIQGDLLLESSHVRVVASENVLHGNLQAIRNRVRVVIEDNQVDGNLQCRENSYRPIGGGNIVKGSKEEQCSRL